VLRNAGLVTDAKDGSRRLYRVDPKGVAGMRDYLDRFWTEGLAAFREAAARQEET
jgi:DNA-binding transcriptional ArsR family regulator